MIRTANFKILSGILLLAVAPQFSNAKMKARVPSQVDPLFMSIKVIYGEKTTLFTISQRNGGGHIDFSNNLGLNKSRDIAAADYDFLKKKISSIPAGSNDQNFCTRSYIEIMANGRQTLACLGASNQVALDAQSIANLLSILF